MKLKCLYLLGLLISICACQKDQQFSVSGVITEAEDKILYLEAVEIDKIVQLDSIKLKKSGNYSFIYNSPEAPEFYRLRINNKIINFSIDSTETIKINAPFDRFSTQYTITGSENSEKIKELVLQQIQLQTKIDTLTHQNKRRNINSQTLNDSLSALLREYKDNIRKNYIYKAPNKTYAYFALFQRVNDFLIFDPLNNKDDVKAFAAVATSLNQAYPHSERSRNLYNMSIKGMKNTRSQSQTLEIDLPEIDQVGLIDIILKDTKGNTHKLSDLKGKVVLLDFTIYQSQIAILNNFELRELYDKYQDKGFEIYQVSLDNDEHFWKTTAINLPWICVRDPNSIYSPIAATYQVENIPAYFLINRNNELTYRDVNIKNIEKELREML